MSGPVFGGGGGGGGIAFADLSQIRMINSNGLGSTNVVIRRFTTVLSTVGTDITVTQSSVDGDKFTINADGIYTISYTDQFSNLEAFGISLNASSLTTAITNIVAGEKIISSTTHGANLGASLSVTIKLSAGDIIRAHTNGETDSTTLTATQFIIARSDQGVASASAVDREFAIPLFQGVPEGVVGYPDVHDLVTASAHVAGSVLPDVTLSTINFKAMSVIPDSLAAAPAARVEFVVMTKSAVAGPQAVRLTVSTLAVADTEALDQAFTAETETSVTMPTATETLDTYSQALTTNPVAGDTVLVKLQRDPADAADLFTGDIQIVSATLYITRTV